MFPSEVSAYFRDLVDEPDETFLTPGNVTTYLNVGYDQFRREVSNIDPLIYAKTVEFAVSGARTVDLTALSTPVLGASVSAGNRMIQLISLHAVDGNSNVSYPFHAVGNVDALDNMRYTFSWRGTSLCFGSDVTETVRLIYLPEANVTWTSGAYFDDLTMFHDVIALFACSQYAMRDGAENQAILRQLNQRVASLREYLSARTLESASYVARVGGDDYGWL